jgi:hypothetical protein
MQVIRVSARPSNARRAVAAALRGALAAVLCVGLRAAAQAPEPPRRAPEWSRPADRSNETVTDLGTASTPSRAARGRWRAT